MKYNIECDKKHMKWLKKEAKSYLKLDIKNPTHKEIKALKRWIKAGCHPQSNPWYYADELGWPMDIISAIRLNKAIFKLQKCGPAKYLSAEVQRLNEPWGD